MTNSTYEVTRRGNTGAWLGISLALILLLGGALSVAAYYYGDPQQGVGEALLAGFGGLVGIVIGLIGAVFGVMVGLVGGVFGIATAGLAVAVTLFVLASPVIAIILIALMARRRRADCPDPAAH